MVRIRIVIAVCHTGNDAKLLTVLLRKLAAQTLSRRGQYRVVVVIAVAEIVDTLTHITDYLQSQLLGFVALAVMLAYKSHQRLGQSDESDTQRSLVDDALDGIRRSQLVGTDPQALHQQRELFGKCRLLELIAVVQLLGSHLQHVVEFCKELVDALLLVFLVHTLNSQLHNIYRREREVASSNGGAGTETVLKYAGTAAHRGHLVNIALRIVSTPIGVLVVSGVEIQEIGKESASRHLTCQLIQVEVTVLRQIVYATFLLPYLDGEDSRLAIADALVGRQQYLAHDATSLGTGVRSVVDTGKDHLVATTRMDGVHIVNESLHRLMHATHRLVHGMLLGTFATHQSVQRFLDIVHQRLLVEV